MRLDRQHKEDGVEFLGVHIYPGSHGGDARYFVDMCAATARMARDHTPGLRKKKIGASTGGVWCCNWTWANLPEPYRSEVAEHYKQVVIEKAAKRARLERENTPTP